MTTTSSFQMRQAASTDWPAIERLLQANHLPLDGAQAHLSTFLLATHQGEVIGCAGAEVHGDIALLRSVAVAPGLHRQGIGQTLVGQMIDQARRRQLRALYLRTTTAAAYFAHFGFEPLPLAHAPAALKASAELQGACPTSAALMVLPLQAQLEMPAGLPVAVIGAGPVGLAAAARLIERGIDVLVLEAGPAVGAHLLDYGHVRLFSPWRYNVDAAMAAQLASTGWTAPDPDDVPLAREVVERVLQPYAALPAVARALHLDTRVLAISREGFDKVKTRGRAEAPFLIRAEQQGRPMTWRARAVIDASGTWSTPNPLGASGLPAIGEREHAEHIAYGIPDVLGRDRNRYAGRRTLVVGAGHSAANALLALAELARHDPQTHFVWAVRSPVLTRVFGGGAADALPARGQLGAALKALRDSGRMDFVAGLHISAIHRDGAALRVEGTGADGRAQVLDGIDQIVCATGQRPDLAMVGELRLKLDPALEATEALGPLIDPNLHSCGTVRPHGHRELAHPEPGFYTLGVKSYGRAPTFLMATGFEQARSVAAAIAGDLVAADRVELDLPETGVCSLGDAALAAAEPAHASSTTGCSISSCGTVPEVAARPRAPQAARCCG